jgi:uncharacterized membrane protein YkgB
MKNYSIRKKVNGTTLLRISLGIVFIWLGLLKFFPGVSPAEDIAGRTFSALSFGYLKPNFSIPFLALWECIIAIGFFTNKGMRWVMILFYLHMLGTFFPLFLFPNDCWAIAAFVPTLLGQYILKNLVLAAAGYTVINAEKN